MALRWVQILTSSLLLIALANALPRVQRSASTNQCPQGEDPPAHYYPYPGDCTKFFQCSNGQPFPLDCPSDQVFSDTAKVCVPRGSHWSTCAEDSVGSSSTTTTATTTTTTTTTENPYADLNKCAIGPDQPNTSPRSYPYPNDCGKFFICSHGVNHLQSCPAGLHFSNALKVCVDPGSQDDTCNPNGV